MSESFGEFLYNWRKAQGWSIREMSRRTGLSYRILINYENEKVPDRKPQLNTLWSLAQTMGLSYIEVCKRAGVAPLTPQRLIHILDQTPRLFDTILKELGCLENEDDKVH